MADGPAEVIRESDPANACWKCHGSGVKTVKAPTNSTSDAAVAKSKPNQSPSRSSQPKLLDVTCPVCNGAGKIMRKRKRPDDDKPQKSFPGWLPVGPIPSGDGGKQQLMRHDGEDLSFLTGQWKIFQHVDTHRYSTDDVVTAWVAWRIGKLLPQVKSTADIGCGLGSVLLMTAWLHPTAKCTGIEAQSTRAGMAARSVEYNGCNDRVRVINGDLRDEAVHALALGVDGVAGSSTASAFDVVTGTPPYFDVSTAGTDKPSHGAVPAEPGAARCLFEYRGGIEAYCEAAARLMCRPHGVFIVCETSLALERGYRAADAAGLSVIARIDCVPKEGKPPLFYVAVMCRKGLEGAFGIGGGGGDGASSDNGTASSSSAAAAGASCKPLTVSAFDLSVGSPSSPSSSSPAEEAAAAAAAPPLPLDHLPYADMRTDEYANSLHAMIRGGSTAAADVAVGNAGGADQHAAPDSAAAGAGAGAGGGGSSGSNADQSISRKQKQQQQPRAKQAARGLHVDFCGKPLVLPNPSSTTNSSSGSSGGSRGSDGATPALMQYPFHGCEVVATVTVRNDDKDSSRTREYKRLLWELGKPG